MKRLLLIAMLMGGTMGVSAQTDMTSRIVNPSFENDLTGWTNSGMAPQGNTSFTLKVGSKYAEKWTGKGNGVGNGSLKQTVSDLPNGDYTLSIVAQNIQQDTPNETQTGVTLQANNDKTAVGVAGKYSVNTTVTNGKLNIAFVLSNATGNYVCVDNFRLTYTRCTLEQLTAMTTEAQTLTEQKMNEEVKGGLTIAIATAQGQTTDEGNTDAAVALSNSIIAAKASVASYAAVKKALDDANTYYATSPANGAEELKAVMDEKQTAYDNGTLNDAQCAAAVAALEAAVMTCHVANATGKAPTVTSEHFMPVGCAAALGRMTASGTNIAEKGYVWATHPNPTVADNRSTLKYDNNGDIYELSPLEPATCYYVRAYAMTKTYAVSYGEEQRIYTLPKATCRWSYGEENDDPAVNDRIRNAVRDACDFYNTWTSIPGFHLNAHYVYGAGAGGGTADCSYGGYMRVSQSVSYQRTGTLLHESNHGVGVGTSHRWKNWDGSNMRADGGERGQWMGWRATQMVRFFEHNETAILNGDGTHMSPYGINGAHEDDNRKISYIANALITHAVHQDGLAAVEGIGASPAYTFEHVDNAKYYITSASDAHGAGKAFLYETAAGALKWAEANDEVLKADDAYAWNFEYVPAKAYYRIKNVKSGKYFTYSGSSIKTATRPTPGNSENFQLMVAFDEVTVGEDKTVTKRPYLIEAGTGNFTPYTLEANTRGATKGAELNLNRNTNVAQRWLILTEDEAMAIGSARLETHTNRLQEVIDGTKAMMAVPHADKQEGATTAIETAVTETEQKAAAITTIAAAKTEVAVLKASVKNFINVAYPSDINTPFDLTFLIEDPTFSDIEYYWNTNDQAVPSATNGVAQVEDSKFKLTQTLTDMPIGIYGAKAQAYQNVETPTAYIFVGTIAYKDLVEPMGADEETAALRYAAGDYDNFAVRKTVKRGDLEIGIVNSSNAEGSKTVFGNFRLYFYGNDVTREDVLATAINEVEREAGRTTSTHIYDLSGRRVTAPAHGIYIKDGKKILVK